MSGTVISRMRWRALDRGGEDNCALTHLDGGWMLVGHARFHDDLGWAALDYVIRCGPDWTTNSADITGTHGETRVALRVVRTGAAWQVNGILQPQVAGATDIDLGFTPATNLMPLRRLPQIGRLPCRAAWLRVPTGAVEPLDQTYTRQRGHIVQYHAEQTGHATQLRVNEHGFVTHYPGLWEVQHAP
ncbi:putative glycolipid-binding domain-containing protein [Puniceibacterium confluentis]|uniref:putative glycolipid-binding domain-containing protein n=1 Tax=Puniceibacterium confluentis TaxID=1958944 RepID=UPI0011B4FDC2|nr:putative glycolipid-binding domain-containing protein [Puniceibacterium confluentis]